MTTLSDLRIAQAAQKAGFPTSEIPNAVAVALAESGGDPNATNQNTDRHHSVDRGGWQINDYWWSDLFHQYTPWSDIDVNAKMAFVVFKDAGSRWTPWVTYNHGYHEKFLDRGRAAAAALDGGGGGFTLTRYLKYIDTARNKNELIHGLDVSVLQHAVAVSADGYFGPATARAVRRFQANHHLTADGIVGPDTAKALGWTFRG